MGTTYESFMTGRKAGLARNEARASNLLKSLLLFGGAPTQQQGMDLNDTLGFSWPKRSLGKDSIQPMMERDLYQEDPLAGEQLDLGPAPEVGFEREEYVPTPGSLNMEMLKNMQSQGREKGITPNEIFGQILQKKTQGLPLEAGEEDVLGIYQSGKKPWYTGYMNEDEIDQSAGIAGGLNINPAQQAKLDQSKSHFDRLMSFKQAAEKNLMERFQQNLMSVDEFRKGMLNLNSTDKAVKNSLIFSILGGGDVPEYDLSTLYGVNLDATDTSDIGDSQVNAIIQQLIATPENQRKDKAQTLLKGFNNDQRKKIFDGYQKALAGN